MIDIKKISNWNATVHEEGEIITMQSARKPTHFSRGMNCQILLNLIEYTKIIKESFIFFRFYKIFVYL